MNQKVIEQEIIGLEQQYWDAMKEGNVETAVSLTRFPCLVASQNGAMKVDENSYKKMMQSHPDRVKDFKIENPMVQVLNDDIAVIAYTLKTGGKECFDTSTWVRENGNWLCALHSEASKANEYH